MDIIKKIAGKNLKTPIKRWNIVRGDYVQVISGRFKGKQGKVLKVIRKKGKIVVEGVNVTKRHVRQGIADKKGQGDEASSNYYFAPSPVPYCTLQLIDPTLNKPTRVTYKFLETGEKVRVSKKSGTIIPKPKQIPKTSERPNIRGPKDTDPEVVLLKTFDENTLNPLLLVSLKHKEWTLQDAEQLQSQNIE